ncbi:RpiB/LacA/LacB family sugar-phosphate isomerase [Clostridium sp. P21]|uniref:RpiB/LacA/LacB family sugar-phosphate isomerase n=1 Tax=Clostridium muellerianum TaxID=2716538 RepID=A0A7Y0EMY7_9CLOT|nr:RpiB/LacA/LacB family sugar-phosphate isomerase [Clostridium muellerianum]NMM65335.1 RpiB/LacA/LacB family sugar-phosphate isomerase [Clostridium muellerianum]
MKRIAIGCDHIVTNIKNELRQWLSEKGYDVVDFGTYNSERTHFPIFGKRVAEALQTGEFDYGVVLCGTGVGITNSANKVKGARCVLARDVHTAHAARRDYDANIIGVGGRISGLGLIENIIEEFLSTEFNATEENVFVRDFMNSMIGENANKGEYFEEERNKWKEGCYHD